MRQLPLQAVRVQVQRSQREDHAHEGTQTSPAVQGKFTQAGLRTRLALDSTLLDRAGACSYKNLPKYRSYRVSNTAPLVYSIVAVFVYVITYHGNDWWIYIPSGAMVDINPSFHRRCAEIIKMASHEPVMRSIIGWFGWTDDWLWKSSWHPTLVDALTKPRWRRCDAALTTLRWRRCDAALTCRWRVAVSPLPSAEEGRPEPDGGDQAEHPDEEGAGGPDEEAGEGGVLEEAGRGGAVADVARRDENVSPTPPPVFYLPVIIFYFTAILIIACWIIVALKYRNTIVFQNKSCTIFRTSTCSAVVCFKVRELSTLLLLFTEETKCNFLDKWTTTEKNCESTLCRICMYAVVLT